VRLVNLKEGDKLVALEIVSEQDLERYASEARERPLVLTPAGKMTEEGEEDENGDGEPDDTEPDGGEPEDSAPEEGDEE
jgi:hypothetical protein